MLAHLRSLIRSDKGTTAVLFGLALPVLLGGAGAAIEYVHLARDKAALQAAADSAALTAARELTLANADDARAITVAKSVAGSALSQQAGIVPGDLGAGSRQPSRRRGRHRRRDPELFRQAHEHADDAAPRHRDGAAVRQHEALRHRARPVLVRDG